MALDLVGILGIGFTIGALTLAFKDNIYWRVCEAIYIGTTGAYIVTIAIGALKSNLVAPLSAGNLLYIIPVILIIMLYGRYVQNYSWINRYPISILIGVGIAVTLRTIVGSMILKQISDTLINPFATGDAIVGTPKTPINNILVIIIVISCAFYFLFWETKWTQNSAIRNFRKFGMTMLMGSFGVLLSAGLVARIPRFGERFNDLLLPENSLYTLVFTIVAVIALLYAYTRKEE